MPQKTACIILSLINFQVLFKVLYFNCDAKPHFIKSLTITRFGASYWVNIFYIHRGAGIDGVFWEGRGVDRVARLIADPF